MSKRTRPAKCLLKVCKFSGSVKRIFIKNSYKNSNKFEQEKLDYDL